eukprot:CAMPEP_0201676578 /NCGR_PEP_ID=MMETSP0494-20130426/42080_1 /ASSEMBLY_ACC=CAM_ASM_000839 /TAXON_ID=420259 /ORGANISM="Thalassiosira gravida, Strain GMp14c1" /LENGTH=156 /DNA_ID=CAMNT_0048159327 /DNA_START=100 /DNA_END=567 /DNA_ORIENTATION=-
MIFKKLHRLLLPLLCIFPSSSLGLTPSNEEEIQSLKQVAYSNPPNSNQSISAWKAILNIDPKNLEAHVILGETLLNHGLEQEYGLELLESAFNPEKVSPAIDYNFPQTYVLASTIGRFRSHKKQFSNAHKFTKLALKLGERHGVSRSEQTCLAMQL